MLRKAQILYRYSFAHKERLAFSSNLKFRLASTEQKNLSPEVYALEEYEDDTEQKEREIEEKRNVSRLRPAHRNIVHGKLPYLEPMAEHHLSRSYKKKMFGRYGHSSGVNPSILWPTIKEVEEIRKYESVAYPFTVSEMIDRQNQKLEEEKSNIKLNQDNIIKNLKKLESWKKAIELRAAKKLEVAEAAKAKKDALIEEVRRQLGYKVDIKDERFKEALILKEREQKKKMKEEKSRLKQEKIMASLLNEK